MEIVNFIKTGDSLKVRFVVKNGVLVVAYRIKLSERNSNTAVRTFDGDNQNTEDDTFLLPVPVVENHERIIRLSADFYGLDLELSKSYSIGIEIYQGNKLLKYVEKTGTLNTSNQNILLFAQLKYV